MGDRVIEDRGIGRQTRHREIIDIAPKREAIEKVSRDVIEPNALSQVVEDFSSSHGFSSCSGHSCIQHIACQKRLVAKLAREEDLFRPTDIDLIT
jgi:hypothetical protein